jgi:hypothetical protein
MIRNLPSGVWLAASALLLLHPAGADALESPHVPGDGILLECSPKGPGAACVDQTALLRAAGFLQDVRLNRIWGERDGGRLWIAGDRGTLISLSRRSEAEGWRADEVPVRATNDGPLTSDLTALWGDSDGAHAWAGGAGGELIAIDPDGGARQVAVLKDPGSAATPPITGGWSSRSGILWVTGGSVAWKLQVDKKRNAKVVAWFVDHDDPAVAAPVMLAGVAGVDETGGHWIVALVDDLGRMILADDSYAGRGELALPAIGSVRNGSPDVQGPLHIYRGIWPLQSAGRTGEELWAPAWYGRLRRLVLTGAHPLSAQCAAGGHACMLDPALVDANSFVDPRTHTRLPFASQLSLSNVNAVAGYQNDVWVAGAHGLLARFAMTGEQGPAWTRIESGVPDPSSVDLESAWAGPGFPTSVWIVGARLCAGRPGYPADGVARLEDYVRLGDPDATAALQCAVHEICPIETEQPCGGVISIPKGVSGLTETLDVTTEVRLVGQGEQSILEWRGGGLTPFGGSKAVIDVHGRPLGTCATPWNPTECLKGMIDPPTPGASLMLSAWRGPVAIEDLTIRSATAGPATPISDTCTDDSVGAGRKPASDAIAVDIHEGYGEYRKQATGSALRNVRLCGFQAGLRLARETQDGTIRDVQFINNVVGLDVESGIQWDIENVVARANGTGVLLNSGEVTLRATRLINNAVGGILITNAAAWVRDVVAEGNVRPGPAGDLVGFDIAVVSSRQSGPSGPSPESMVRSRVPVPMVRQGPGRVLASLENLTLNGTSDVPGRVLVLNPANPRSGRCGIGRVSLKGAGGTRQPLLDVLDECAPATRFTISDSDIQMRRLSDPTAAPAPITPLSVTSIPGFVPAETPPRWPNAGSFLAAPERAGLAMTDNGQLSVGAFLTPELAKATRRSLPAPALIVGGSKQETPRGAVNLVVRQSADVRFLLGAAASGAPGASIGTEEVAEKGSDLVFRLDSVGSSSGKGEALRVTSDGRVGIGTAHPEDRLDVVGDVKTNGSISGGGRLVLTPDSSNACGSSEAGRIYSTETADSLALFACGSDGKAHAIVP